MAEEMRRELSSSSPEAELSHTKMRSNGEELIGGNNGQDKIADNTTASTNGIDSKHLQPQIKFFGHDREEVTRLLMQGLDDLGYGHLATQLGHESGYCLESPIVLAFRESIRLGDWDTVERIIQQRYESTSHDGSLVTNGNKSSVVKLPLADHADVTHMQFLIREQKYTELIRNNQKGLALAVLQTEIQALKYQDPKKMNRLSGLLVTTPSDQDNDPSITVKTRDRLLRELSQFISPSAILPQHRLATLLDQVYRGQVSKCLYHNPVDSKPYSLFIDHACDEVDFPLYPSIELSQGDGEIWFVEFSNDGRHLVTCGESRTAVVYDTATFQVKHKLSDHQDAVVYASWSPNDKKLVTCSQDAKARVWDMQTGKCLQVIDHHEQAVTTASWTPDGSHIVTGSLDKHSQLCLRSSDGHEPFTWPADHRTQDCAITADGRRLIAMSPDNYITVYDLPQRTKLYGLKVAHRMTCLSVSRDSRTMLVNMANDEIHLINIETAEIIRRYTGQVQASYVIRSGFGGSDEGLIVSGSADSNVYIWHKENGTLIEKLEGHTHGCVNSVAWNPQNPGMFASGGDDKKVRIWTKERHRRGRSQSSHRRQSFPHASS